MMTGIFAQGFPRAHSFSNMLNTLHQAVADTQAAVAMPFQLANGNRLPLHLLLRAGPMDKL